MLPGAGAPHPRTCCSLYSEPPNSPCQHSGQNGLSRPRARPPTASRCKSATSRRALEDAKTTAGLDGGEARLSWHSLRHSWASLLATDVALPATTLARITGHADAGFTLKVYARDARDETAMVDDVLARAAAAGVGT